VNCDALKEFLEDGGKTDEEQRQRWTEL